jgi:hypothetical protein
VTLRRRLAEGSIVESAPSQRIIVRNSGAGLAVRFSVNALAATPYYAWAPVSLGGTGFDAPIAGDELCIYRSPSITPSTDTPSDEMRLRAVLTFSTADNSFIGSAENYAWLDMLPDDAWSGASLYTNSTQGSLAFSNYRPQYARDLALYKGCTYYAGAKTAQNVTLQLRAMSTGTVEDFSQVISSQAFTGSISTGVASITGISAADELKIAVGQVVTSGSGTPGLLDARFPANTTITGISGGVATTSAAALSTAAATDLHV